MFPQLRTLALSLASLLTLPLLGACETSLFQDKDLCDGSHEELCGKLMSLPSVEEVAFQEQMLTDNQSILLTVPGSLDEPAAYEILDEALRLSFHADNLKPSNYRVSLIFSGEKPEWLGSRSDLSCRHLRPGTGAWEARYGAADTPDPEFLSNEFCLKATI